MGKFLMFLVLGLCIQAQAADFTISVSSPSKKFIFSDLVNPAQKITVDATSFSGLQFFGLYNNAFLQINLAQGRMAASQTAVRNNSTADSVGSACGYTSSDCTGTCYIVPTLFSSNTDTLTVKVAFWTVDNAGNYGLVTPSSVDSGPVTINSRQNFRQFATPNCLTVSPASQSHSIVPTPASLPVNLVNGSNIEIQ